MKFKRVDQKTVRCIISEQEIIERGLKIEDLLRNGDKVQEFLNEVVDLAEAETGFKLTSGIQAVQAAFLPNRDIVFTFSDSPEGFDFDKTMEQWRDLFAESKIGSVKKKDDKEITIEDETDLYITIGFDKISKAGQLSKHIPFNLLTESSLYRLDDVYYLSVIVKNISLEDRKTMFAVVSEYTKEFSKAKARVFFIKEHGESILEKNAVDILKNIFS